MLRKAILLATVVTFVSGAAFGQPNELVNGDFESNPPPMLGNNIGYSIAPWVLGSGNKSNVVKVDGPGGYDYGTSGPESDATAPGAGVPQHYLDIADGRNDFYQSFTTRCVGDVTFGGAFSTRANLAGTASIALRQGVGTSGAIVGSTNVINLPGGTSKTDPWALVSFTATLPIGMYSFVVTMDNNMNFDDGFVRYTKGCGQLKVCKVAGIGVPVGAPFTFSAGGSTFTVPAGPPPGGTCVIGPAFPAGTGVTVAETIPPGHVVSDITVLPKSQIVGMANLATGSVNVSMSSGVTEVTYTDKRTGFLEICKRGDVRGDFTFTVNPGALGPFVVPAGACSPAIEVVAGSVTIQEMPATGYVMAGCATIPASQQGACDPKAQTSTVTIAPGDVSAQTIAIIDNRRIRDHFEVPTVTPSSSPQR